MIPPPLAPMPMPTPSASTPHTSTPPSPQTEFGVVLGAVLGLLVLIIAGCICYAVWYKMRQRKKRARRNEWPMVRRAGDMSPGA